MRWKHRFDKYKESLPAYYNSYMNTCLKYIFGALSSDQGKQAFELSELMFPEHDKYFRDYKARDSLNKNLTGSENTK